MEIVLDRRIVYALGKQWCDLKKNLTVQSAEFCDRKTT